MSVNQLDTANESPADKAEADLDHEASNDDDHRPIVVKFEEVSAAAFKIRGGVEYTPCNVSYVAM